MQMETVWKNIAKKLDSGILLLIQIKLRMET